MLRATLRRVACLFCRAAATLSSMSCSRHHVTTSQLLFQPLDLFGVVTSDRQSEEMTMQCPKCKGSGTVLSHLNPHDANKVGAGMGLHRCDRCAGQGVVHGAAGTGGGQQLGDGLMAMVAALFLHPFFSFVGFWLICTGLLLALGSVLGTAAGFDMNHPPTWFFGLAMGISGVLAALLAGR